MSGERYLIVNADDFGLSPGVNRGIVRAHEEGIVTSASLMVRRAGARHAAKLAARYPRLSVGLHVDLGDWERGDDGEWRVARQIVGNTESKVAVWLEVQSQLRAFERLMGRRPTHLDSHQHVHTGGPARGAVFHLGRWLGVPVRHADDRIRYCGDFFGIGEKGEADPQRITPAALVALTANLSPGTTELCTHPGEACDDVPYGPQRSIERETLCHPSVRAAVEATGVRLISFSPPPPHPLSKRPPAPPSILDEAWRRVRAKWNRPARAAERSPI